MPNSPQLKQLACVDKTQFIEALETCGSRYVLIVRPPRFGKTFFTRLLEAYYDEAAADRFEHVFADTWIGARKTALASQFRVFRLDFSGLSSAHPDDLPAEFLEAVKASVRQYFNRYPHPNQNEVLQEDFSSATALITRFFSLAAEAAPKKMYVIIDAYDQFARGTPSEDSNHSQSAVSSEAGFIRFFAKLKAATRYAVARIFLTGVTSVSLDAMTTGFNIATNFTTDPAFAGICGFTEAELRDLAPQLMDLEALGLTLDSVIDCLKARHSAYRFSPYSETVVFNPATCLRHLAALQCRGEEAEALHDHNSDRDPQKLEAILQRGNDAYARSIVTRALRREPIPFPSSLQTLSLPSTSPLSTEALLSALFYEGFLTYEPGDSPSLVVPDPAARLPYFKFVLSRHGRSQSAGDGRSLGANPPP